jgi:hypothetical protein
MNYKPFVGWWFIGATSGTERVHYFSSWGLLRTVGGGPTEITDFPKAIPWIEVHAIHPIMQR